MFDGLFPCPGPFEPAPGIACSLRCMSASVCELGTVYETNNNALGLGTAHQTKGIRYSVVWFHTSYHLVSLLDSIRQWTKRLLMLDMSYYLQDNHSQWGAIP